MPPLYRSFNAFLKEKFPSHPKIRKIPINAGMTCPNRDGTLADTGCLYCDVYGSGPIKTFDLPIAEQIERFLQNHPGRKFLAYYQAFSNTAAPVAELKKKYEIIFNYPDILGLFIGTRPDCIAEPVYPLLEDLARRTYLCVELGLQTVHDRSLEYLERHHAYGQFLDTFARLKERRIDTVVHLILGIPGETREDMLQTVEEMNRIKPTGIKFHLLHILKDTRLFKRYRQEPFKLMEEEEYCELVVFLLERLDPGIVVHRLTGERDRQIFFAPEWALDKAHTINRIRALMKSGETFQGKLYTKRGE